MFKYFFFTIGILFSLPVIAQETSPIDTDRPDQSEGVYVLEKNFFQIENGFTFSKETTEDNLMLRYGIAKSTELRFSTDIEKNTAFQIDNLTLSFKQRIIEREQLPSITLIGYGIYHYQDSHFSTEVALALEKNVWKELSIVANIGLQNQWKEFKVTAQANYTFFDSITLFGEYYAFFPFGESPSHNIDTGAMCLINKNLQLDFAYGRTLFKDTAEPFFVIGVSYRMLPNKHKKI